MPDEDCQALLARVLLTTGNAKPALPLLRFYRQAADIHQQLGNKAKEGIVMGNLEETLRKPCRYVASYLAYRRDGGDNHTIAGRIAHAVTETLSSEGAGAVIAMLQYSNSSGDVIPAGKRVSSAMNGNLKYVHVVWIPAQICLEQIWIYPKGDRQG